MDRLEARTQPTRATQPLLRPANDSLRPLSTVELALQVRPATVKAGGGEGRWTLHPQYALWLAQHFPRDRVWICPLADYDAEVRGPAARLTLEELHTRLEAEAERTGGYRLAALNGWRRRTAMFAVGSHRLKALTEFLFAWG